MAEYGGEDTAFTAGLLGAAGLIVLVIAFSGYVPDKYFVAVGSTGAFLILASLGVSGGSRGGS